ncbi:MAG: acylase [Gemmatimonadetes bacterium]|nr:acylase [Gemmatimonadota bacterium]
MRFCSRIRISSLAGGLLLGLLLVSCNSTRPAPKRTEILWDSWGVPHVFARSGEELHYAFGWAQMENHADLILRLYGQARGRAAEYWGASFAEGDRNIRRMGVPERARVWYEAQGMEYRVYLDAFARGMNEYAEAHRELIGDEMERVLPVTPVDAMAHLQRVIHLTFVGGAASPGARQWAMTGSNAWAIGPERTANGNAMLLANPHLPWSDLFMLFEAHLVTAEVDVYGATLVGMPALAIAFNDYLGWTHTNNTFDGMDLYELTLEDGGYVWGEDVRAFETETQVMKIRQEDGSLLEEEWIVRHSIHGPVVAEKEGKGLAMRLTGLDQPNFFEQYWQMAKATDLEEFEAALARLQNPYFNLVYADRDGHILYLFGGRTPKRPSGDWSFWQGVVPGNSAATLWTETHPYEELPRVVDPPSGWVQNVNDPPWTSTFPMQLRADDFPAYMAPRFMHFRAQRSVRMLAEDEEISFEKMVAYKHSTRMELADRVLDELISAAREKEGELVNRAADVLAAWDRKADADSRGAVLFSMWFQVARQNGFRFAESWSMEKARTTPAGIGDPAAAVVALEVAARQMEEKGAALDIPWGEVYRIGSDRRDLPGNGAPGGLGVFRVMWFSPEADGRFRASGGDSYVAAVEFSDPVRAKVLLSYGNASQPGSPHRGDQLELLARQELRPAWRNRAEIEANLEKRELPIAE